MFGMGGSEIIVILIVALLFLGPDKLPQAAKQISKGIRDIKKQSRSLQQQIESDEQIGGAIRDIKSALRGEEAPIRPKLPKRSKKVLGEAIAGTALAAGVEPAVPEVVEPAVPEVVEAALVVEKPEGEIVADAEPAAPKITLSPVAGEPDVDSVAPHAADDDDLAAMIKPAPGTIAKGSESGHG